MSEHHARHREDQYRLLREENQRLMDQLVNIHKLQPPPPMILNVTPALIPALKKLRAFSEQLEDDSRSPKATLGEVKAFCYDIEMSLLGLVDHALLGPPAPGPEYTMRERYMAKELHAAREARHTASKYSALLHKELDELQSKMPPDYAWALSQALERARNANEQQDT